MMNISQFSHNRPNKPFHSSGYANVSRGGAMGSMNVQSFGERNDMERNRSSVNRYRDSMVGQAYVHQNVQPRVGENAVTPARAAVPRHSRQGASVRPQPRAAFREPPTRYNPYG